MIWLQQYAKVGDPLSHFSHTIVALHECLQSEIQVLNQLSWKQLN